MDLLDVAKDIYCVEFLLQIFTKQQKISNGM